MLGLLGGALAAAMSIRNLRGTSTPYDVPVALALLKVPLGAFTAIVGLVAIQGQFIPGLSALDSQQQILAYALVLGYAQQVFTDSLDRKAQTLLDGLPAKDAATAPPGGAALVAQAAEAQAVSRSDVAAARPQFAPHAAANGDEPKPPQTIDLPQTEAEFQPPPPADDDDAVQDDGRMTMPNVPAGDHR